MQNKTKVPKNIYRIHFHAQNTMYQLYAQHIEQSDLFGFLEVEEIMFGENTSLVVDPSEERLKNEFQDVKKTYIPMDSILRIDVVEKEGTSKISVLPPNSEKNISHFPASIHKPRDIT